MENIRKLIKTLVKEALETPVQKPKVSIKKATKKDFDTLMNLCDDIILFPNFERVCSKDPSQRIQNLYDPKFSYKAIVDGKIVGFYFLTYKETISNFLEFISKQFGEANIDLDEEAFERLKVKKGVEGLTIGVSKDYRGLGIGKILLDIPKKLGVDYVWGIQTRGLSNMDVMLKHRKVLASIANGKWIISYQEF